MKVGCWGRGCGVGVGVVKVGCWSRGCGVGVLGWGL